MTFLPALIGLDATSMGAHCILAMPRSWKTSAGIYATNGRRILSGWGLPDYQKAAMERHTMCLIITESARNHGLDTNPDKVNRQFNHWLSWYHGRLCTGYLIRTTGVRRVRTP